MTIPDFKNSHMSVSTARHSSSYWRPIETAPKDGTPVDIWRQNGKRGERCTNMRRVDLGDGNVFYEPIYFGVTCVRDATHWLPVPASPFEDK